MTTEHYAELELGVHQIQAGSYQVELRFTDPDPNNQAEVAAQRQPTSLDLGILLKLQLDADAYAAALTEQIFSDEQVRLTWGKIKTAVESRQLYMRLRLLIGASAPELHGLRWELLRDPETQAPLATSEKILFSRFMLSQSWRPVRLRAKTELTALIAVAAIGSDNDYGLAAVDGAGEIERASASLQNVEQINVLGDNASAPLTLERLIDGLRTGIDILYLVCHGALSSRGPILYLQDEKGGAKVNKAEEFAQRLAELTQLPRLVVLASCESAAVAEDKTAAQTALAPHLAEAGVPAVLAMQGKISMATVKTFMPKFFSELLIDGQIDRALAVARGEVRSQSDSWMPALFLRLRGGRIWYVPGFAGEKDEFEQWKSICGFINSGEVVPIIGPDLVEHVYGNSVNLAVELALENDFPLSEQARTDLAKVTQYITTKDSIKSSQAQVRGALLKQMRMNARLLAETIPVDTSPKQLLQDIITQLLQDDTDPCRILAELDAKVYVSASATPIMERLLQEQGKKPIPLVSQWRDERRDEREFYGDPSTEKPYVYYVYGDIRQADTWVLTEDDFFDYLIQTSLYHELMPPVIGKALTHSCLLFLGFALDDWKFRLLFRMIMAKGGHAQLRKFNHVGVQVNPDEHTLADAERAKDYLQRYFVEAKIDIYWGSASDFLNELNEQRKKIQLEQPAVAIADAEEW